MYIRLYDGVAWPARGSLIAGTVAVWVNHIDTTPPPVGLPNGADVNTDLIFLVASGV